MSAARAPTPARASVLLQGLTDPNYAPPPDYLWDLTILQLHRDVLETIKKKLQVKGTFVCERIDDAALLR
jgi:hypothetical protein